MERVKLDQKVAKYQAQTNYRIMTKHVAKHDSTLEKLAKYQLTQSGGPLVALDYLRTANRQMMELPPVLRPLVIIVAILMFRNAAEKRRNEREMEQAHHFLRERYRLRL